MSNYYKKIVFLIDSFPPLSRGGAGVVAFRLARGLLKRGHEVHIITSVQNNEELGELLYEGLKLHRIFLLNQGNFRFFRGLYNREAIRKIKRILTQIKPDVIHAHTINGFLSWWSLVVAKRFTKKLFITVHDVLPFAYSRLTHFVDKSGNQCPVAPDYRMTFLRRIRQAKKKFVPFREAIIGHILNNYADKIFSVSNELKLALNQNGFENVEVIHNCVDPEIFNVLEGNIAGFKTKYGLENKKIILLGGRLMGSKGIEQLLQSMVLVSRQYENVLLLIIGSGGGDFNSHLAKKLQNLGLENFVRHEEWIPPDSFKLALVSADIVAVPSLCFDSFPTMALDGAAVGKPVIATCFGGAKEIILDGENGFVLNPYDINLMAEKIIHLLRNPDIAKKMGEAGRKRIKEKFSISRQIEITLYWYNKD